MRRSLPSCALQLSLAGVAFEKAAQHFAHSEACLLVMRRLVAMTFNVWLFLAVPLGFALGALLFGHLGREPDTVIGDGSDGNEGDGTLPPVRLDEFGGCCV